MPVPTLSLPKAARELPSPADREPAHALAFWGAAMEARNWARARSVFGEFGAQSGMSTRDFARAWDKYHVVDVTIGTGVEDAGAGSSYYRAPVTITGLTQDAKPYRLTGHLTLRRLNDIEGATPEQLRWHIERSTLRP